MRNVICDRGFDEERALYHLQETEVRGCTFAGPADGESPLKEGSDLYVHDCRFSLRYPLWHLKTFTLENSLLDEKTRAPLWYCQGGKMQNVRIHGVKAIRECMDINILSCEILSEEFGWKSKRLRLSDTTLTGDYAFLDSRDITAEGLRMKGKYSFQYMKNLEIRGSFLDTKDAFWHSRNVTVRNSVVKGEYLGWFSEGLTLIDCAISGTQPFCYCKNLKLVRCTMDGCDLSFECSEVTADVKGAIDSVKNPHEGLISADDIGEVIVENPVMPCHAAVTLRDGTVLYDGAGKSKRSKS